MRKALTTLLLVISALLSVTAAVFLAIDGSLARLTGWYHFRPGMALFPQENLRKLGSVCWMRIQDLHDRIECERAEDGSWWITVPFRDRMSPAAVQSILNFTAGARLVDSLPLNRTTRASMREFGVESSPHVITLKMPAGDSDLTTVARYTLGNSSPWLADAEDGEHLLPTTYLRTDYYGRDKRIHVVSGNILHIFKNGLEGLRDPQPLNFTQEEVLSLDIRRKGQPDLSISRVSPQSPWNLTAPTYCEAYQERVDTLLSRLEHLKAIRIDDAAAIELPQDDPDTTILLTLENGSSLQLSLYEPFTSPTDGQTLCYATVADRPVVFTLAVEPKLRRKGGYASIVNGILSLPVLSRELTARIRNASNTVYTSDLPLTSTELRSPYFSNIQAKDIDRVVLRSRFYPYPVRLLRIPGDEEGQMDDMWMYSAAGKKYKEADPEIVKRFLNGMSSIPVSGYVKDFAPTEDVRQGMRDYGLDRPDYTIIMQPRECAVRAALFGIDLPLVKDRAPRIFYVSRYREENQSSWIGMELDTDSIYRLSPKMTKLFSFFPEDWQKRNLVQFPVSALRTLTLFYQSAPLKLQYDYIGEAWTGSLDREDVTPRINPHRTNYYVRHLQNIRVLRWLQAGDEEALAALKHPVFSVRLELELTDYSSVESIVVRQKESDIADDATANEQMVEKMLTESDAEDDMFRQMALGDKKTEKRTITIEIAPSDNYSDRPFFYGRIREDGSLFIMSYDDAQGLDGRLLD